MDRRKKFQALKKALTLYLGILLCVFIAGKSCAQCTDSIIVIKSKGCIRYEVSRELMLELFVAKKSLDTIGGYLSIIKSKLDSSKVNQNKIDSNTNDMRRVLAIERRTRIEKDSINNYTIGRQKQVLSDTVNDLEKLQYKFERNRKKLKPLVIGSFTVGVAFAALVFSLFK